jgi:hypothetical protein
VFVSTNRGRFVTSHDHYLGIWPSSLHLNLLLKLIFRQAPSGSICSDTIPYIHVSEIDLLVAFMVRGRPGASTEEQKTIPTSSILSIASHQDDSRISITALVLLFLVRPDLSKNTLTVSRLCLYNEKSWAF